MKLIAIASALWLVLGQPAHADAHPAIPASPFIHHQRQAPSEKESRYRSIIAWIPLEKLERLAEDPAVRAIEPAAEAAIR